MCCKKASTEVNKDKDDDESTDGSEPLMTEDEKSAAKTEPRAIKPGMAVSVDVGRKSEVSVLSAFDDVEDSPIKESGRADDIMNFSGLVPELLNKAGMEKPAIGKQIDSDSLKSGSKSSYHTSREYN